MHRHPFTAMSAALGAALGLALACASTAAFATPKAPAEQAAIFDYDKAASVPELAGGVRRKAKCCDITEWKLARPEANGGGDIELTTLVPLGKKGATFPTVLWLQREGTEVRRAMFLQEAEQLAANGIASVLVELPFKQPYVHRADNNAGDADVIKNAVIDARRALDWAAAKPWFDAKRVGVVGQRFGAWTAALLAGVDERVGAVILMSPPGKPSGWLQVSEQPKAKQFRETFDKAEWFNYLNSIVPLDPERWIGFAAPATLYFQFGSRDEWTQTLEQVDLFRAASSPKSRQMFEADELLNDEARKARNTWLRKELLQVAKKKK